MGTEDIGPLENIEDKGIGLLLPSLELGPILPAVTPLAKLALWLAFPAVTPHANPTNGKAPRRRTAREVS